MTVNCAPSIATLSLFYSPAGRDLSIERRKEYGHETG